MAASVSRTEACALVRAVFASVIASVAARIFSGSLAACAATSCSRAACSFSAYWAAVRCPRTSFSFSMASFADRAPALVSTSLMPAEASLNRLWASCICLPREVTAASTAFILSPAACQLVWDRRRASLHPRMARSVSRTDACALFRCVCCVETASAAFWVALRSASCCPASCLTSLHAASYSCCAASMFALAAMVAESLSPRLSR